MRLMRPSYARSYVKRQQDDTADAEAICEAVSLPTMRVEQERRSDGNHSRRNY